MTDLQAAIGIHQLEKLEQMQNKVDEFGESINEDTFATMVEIHELMEAGDMEAVKALKEELGFDQGLKFYKGMGWKKCPLSE